MEGADGKYAKIMGADKCQRQPGHVLIQLIEVPYGPESIGGYQPTTGSGRSQRGKQCKHHHGPEGVSGP